MLIALFLHNCKVQSLFIMYAIFYKKNYIKNAFLLQIQNHYYILYSLKT